MLRYLYLFLLLSGPLLAQEYEEDIAIHRDEYMEEFLTTPNSPLKKEDLDGLRFYEPNLAYRVEARFVATPKSAPFEMPTYDGKQKTYVKYGELHFQIQGKLQKLIVYQSLGLRQLPQYRDYLFIPFKDPTNGQSTYGGGRYLDLRLKDIKDKRLLLDFNKAYNPYCAYSDGYSCPIPPKENHLKVAIEAGERTYVKAR
ncbi:DUF1684 domain-containing protein [Telluribacter sp. SYSU D00476]|uniref:DUF1684 domain-containing protein n=1 Tax=Telluribacter sp. SYSU D00476 TaxID=2811430 RepID=UPI001FF58040|nr:DUF1684 domain-containing protein [Telluribacter sp. SYSU D00476]